MILRGAIQIGLLAAIVASVPAWIRSRIPFGWSSPVLVLGVAVVAVLLQRYFVDRRPGYRGYDGVADLLVHVHAPSESDPASRWFVRGAISFLLTLFGGLVGPEGAAIEVGHAWALRTRTRSARWFEQRRRTDAGATLAAGVAAAFGAPFAGMLIPVELGLGGRTLSVALASITAFLGMRTLATWFPGSNRFIETMAKVARVAEDARIETGAQWATIAAIAVAGGLLGALLIRFVRYSRDSLLDLFRTQAWMRVLAGGVLLFMILLIHPGGPGASGVGDLALFEQLGLTRQSPSAIALLISVLVLQLAMVLGAFGTAGIFFPLLLLGGHLGALAGQLILAGGGGDAGYGSFAVFGILSGAAAVWGAVIGAPLAAAVLAYELTQNLHVLLPCLVAGFGAQSIRGWLRTPALVTLDLDSRGLKLVEGRSRQIMESLPVREAMVTDHEAVSDQEPIAELKARLARARYPFFPVVNAQGVYVGLLTADMVQDAWRAQSRLLEAKDILYRQGFRTPVARANDPLSATAGYFDDLPCVPVLSDDRRVAGLLFVYSVRMVYDREVGRRSHLPGA
jgi:CIC family chloride channel protein